MANLYNYIPLELPVSEEFRNKCIEWVDTLYSEQWQDTPRWTDQFVDTDLNIDDTKSKKIVLTRFGSETRDYETLQNSFWCITGYDLYNYMPWYKPMEEFLEAEAGLTSHLDFPCLIISKGKVRKHPDVGRKTVLNYDIFGSETMRWGIDDSVTVNEYDIETEDETFTETYTYPEKTSVIVNVNKVHGANKVEGFESYKRSAINHGFWEDFEVVSAAFEQLATSGKLEELQSIIYNA